MVRGHTKAFLCAFRAGRIKFFVVGDGMITWRWVDDRLH
jgi:hypothetical protein